MRLHQLLTLLPLLLMGLIAGFFYAFSVSVMPGLDQIAPSAAIEAMQAINQSVQNPMFFVTFFLTPVATALSSFFLWRASKARAACWMAAGGLTYLLGALFLTIQINVPMNATLALIDPTVENAGTLWRQYSQDWTFWNTVRTGASSMALLMIAIAMLLPARSTNAEA